MRGFELGTETDRMFADAEQKRAEREVGKTEFQQVVDASGTKPMTPQEMLYTSASVAPITGDVIAYKEAPEDFERAYELMQRGYKEKDLVNLGLGAAFAGLVTLGLVPGIGFVSRIGKNAAKDSIKKLLKEGNLDKAADAMVNTSKVFNDKALTSKKAEKQLKDLARAKIKLNNMTGKKTSDVDLLHAELPKEKLSNIDSQEYSNIINDLSKDVEVKKYLSNKYDNADDSIEVAFPENFRPKNEIAAFNNLRKGSEIRIDNPSSRDVFTGETYVQKKIRENNEFKANNPNSGPIGSFAGTTGFVDKVKFNPKELIEFKGAAGEEKYRMSGKRQELLQASIKEKGYLNADKGGDRLLIHVTEDGTPYITEGNHRLAEAFMSNRPFISADIRYLRGAESVDGPLNPNKIGIGKDAPKSNDASNLNRGGLMARA